MRLITVWLMLGLLTATLTMGARAQKTSGNEKPYIGTYTLDQGGTDAAGAVHLLLFSGGDYAIVYFGGMQQGTWQAMPDGELKLQEWATDPADFVVYGRKTPALAGEVKLHFQGFQESYAKIGLSETTGHPAKLALHPAFNDDANCYGRSYDIKRPADKVKAIHLAAYQEGANAKDRPVQFSKKLLYTFLLDKRYNDYQVLYRAEASKPRVSYTGRVVKDNLTLYPAGIARPNEMPGDAYGERSEISAADLSEMLPFVKEAREPLPAQLAIESEAGKAPASYQRIPGTSQPLHESAVQLLAPLFGARCD